jgi:hypothetical protein
MAKPIRQKDINFLSVIDAKQDRQALSKFLLACIAVIAAFLVLSLCVFVFGLVAQTGIQSEKNRIEEYLNDPNTLAALAASNVAANDLAEINKQNEALKSPISSIETHPLLRPNDIRTILNLEGSQVEIGVIYFNVESGLLEFTADIEGENIEGVPYYITQLRNSGIYADVTYRGYNETGVGGAGAVGAGASGGSQADTSGASLVVANGEESAIPVVREGHEILSVQCLVKTDAAKLASEQEAARKAAEKKANAKKKKSKAGS